MKKEIEAKDLRIGNWVSSKLHKGLKTEIHSVMPNSVKLWANPLANGYNLDEIEGIPLTPEILEKAGFENRSHLSDWFIHLGDSTTILIFKNWEAKICASNSIPALFMDCIYLHTLQNMFHTLTNEELNIEL